VRRRRAGAGALGAIPAALGASGLAVALGACGLALALAGCGLVTAPAPTAVQLLVTRDFGSRVLHRSGALRAGAGETVIGLLSSEYAVRASSGGKLVQGIDGLSSGAQAGAPGQTDEWSYYVNGVQASGAPATTSVHPGDHVWWDLHDASQARSTPAIVGAFPEPFLNGIEGARLPVRIECASVDDACRTVTASLRAAGVPAALAAIGSGGAPETLRVMVGPWSHLNGDLEAESIGNGPSASGVYARFSANGQALTLLDQQGRAVRTLRADAGLVAATKGAKEAPVWVVTGTDDAGVELAARAFNRTTLADRFAVALAPGGAIALPVLAAATR
jgi:uncharacterized protein DUF4430